MVKGHIFENNGAQAVQLPDEMRFPSAVRQVHVRIVGCDRILSPTDRSWDSFFQSETEVTQDFMTERSIAGANCE